MKTSETWWQSIKLDDQKINGWLLKQWRGEVTAAHRIRRLSEQYVSADSQAAKVLETIAKQEQIHAKWIRELITSRRLLVDEAAVVQAEERYWKEALLSITDFETGTAIAAHAEGMRLERIRVIAADESAPSDIRSAFEKILKDEEWHEQAFSKLSSPAALVLTSASHKAGMAALGLVI